jgi:hypothetical protein
MPHFGLTHNNTSNSRHLRRLIGPMLRVSRVCCSSVMLESIEYVDLQCRWADHKTEWYFPIQKLPGRMPGRGKLVFGPIIDLIMLQLCMQCFVADLQIGKAGGQFRTHTKYIPRKQFYHVGIDQGYVLKLQVPGVARYRLPPGATTDFVACYHTIRLKGF